MEFLKIGMKNIKILNDICVIQFIVFTACVFFSLFKNIIMEFSKDGMKDVEISIVQLWLKFFGLEISFNRRELFEMNQSVENCKFLATTFFF